VLDCVEDAGVEDIDETSNLTYN